MTQDEQNKPIEDEALSDELRAEGDDEVIPQAQDTADATAQQELESLRAEFDQQHQRLLRVSADYQNYIRRSQQNVRDAGEQAVMDIAKAVVSVLDHFDRALEVDREKATVETMVDGMMIVRDELLSSLQRFGVQRIDVQVGDEFDPQKHEALMRQTVEGIETNHVTAQLQPGYVLRDKTLRPAQVSVAQ